MKQTLSQRFSKCGLDLGWPQPAAAWSTVSVPGQWLRSGPGSESTKSQPPDQRSATRPWPYSFAEKEFPQRRKVVKRVKYLLGGKKEYSTCGETHGWTQRVVPSWITFMGHFCWPLANHFDLPDSESVFGLSQDFPTCARTSLSQDGFYWRGLWAA